MQPLSRAPLDAFDSVRFVLTDMDDTLTYRGRIASATIGAIERLQASGIRVIPVTAAPAGWCDQMARMWPVDGVIAENGGLFIHRSAHGAERLHWHSEGDLDIARARLREVAAVIERVLPEARLADDQPYRLDSLAYRRAGDRAEQRLVSTLAEAGARTTINSLWVLGWWGDYDKLAMSQRILSDVFGVSGPEAIEQVAYAGDSLNDAPMFAHFKYTAGVSTVVDCLPQLPKAPTWVTRGPGGAGFVEFADAILKGQAGVAV
ncbi:HAD family hydrolase [Uliginosibacterium sp. sgz301328]|uniref:HAD family hydrolase n=1 Tax=Uliginosibacterium sp. sgz301328 TaxID=3243764 RepID=UPI00359E2DB3